MKFEENTHSVEILEFSVNLREISFENFKVLKWQFTIESIYKNSFHVKLSVEKYF